MIYFQPASRVASCKTLATALHLSRFMNQWFTEDPLFGQTLTFHAVKDTSGKVSVHASSPVDEPVLVIFKQAVAEFKASYVAATAAA